MDDPHGKAQQDVDVTASRLQIRLNLWADAYMSRLQQGNSVKQVDYMAHHAAVEVADRAVEAFDKRFAEAA